MSSQDTSQQESQSDTAGQSQPTRGGRAHRFENILRQSNSPTTSDSATDEQQRLSHSTPIRTSSTSDDERTRRLATGDLRVSPLRRASPTVTNAEEYAKEIRDKDAQDRHAHFASRISGTDVTPLRLHPRIDLPNADGVTNLNKVIPPYLQLVLGENYVDVDNSVQDMRESYRVRRNGWMRRYQAYVTARTGRPTPVGEYNESGGFLLLHPLNGMELQFAVQTYYDNFNLYQLYMQEGRDLLALRHYRRTLEVNLFIISYFADSRLQAQARTRIPHLYNHLTMTDLTTIVNNRITFFRGRAMEAYTVDTGFFQQELLRALVFSE